MKKPKQHNNTLIISKSRSYRSDFNEGWKIFILNIPALLKSLWVPCCAAGVVLAILFAVWRLSSPVAAAIEGVVALLLILYIISVMTCATGHLLRTRIDLTTRRIQPVRPLKDLLCFCSAALSPFYLLVVEFVVLGLIAWGGTKLFNVNPSLVSVAVALALIVSVPFAVSFSGLVFSEEHSMKRLWEGARLSFSNFWGTLMLVFLSLLIVGIIIMLLFLPIFILNLAISASHAAVTYGDPTDLPNYVYVLHFFITVLLMSMAAFSCLIGIFPQYLHYFSLLTKKKEKQEHQRN
jgi:hypothetical protein